MSNDQDVCEWVSVSSLLAYPGSRGPMAVKWLCVCVCSDSFKSNIKFNHYLNNSAKSQINKAKLAEIPYNGGGKLADQRKLILVGVHQQCL